MKLQNNMNDEFAGGAEMLSPIVTTNLGPFTHLSIFAKTLHNIWREIPLSSAIILIFKSFNEVGMVAQTRSL